VAIYSFGDKVPNIHPSAFVHPEAVIIGDAQYYVAIQAELKSVRAPQFKMAR
jgi:carbonic anhydrase/acetyltransferase-like protein (isoleucine patch superfamily)